VATAAAADPRVRGLVLLGPTTDPRLRSAWGLASRWATTALREPLWQAPLVAAQWSATGPRAMVALWRAGAPDRLDLRLRDVRVPVVVVRGERDGLCDRRWAAHLAAAAPDGRLVELAGAAHMAVHTHPGPVAAVVRSAVARAAACPGHRPAAG
jgi:pimeloyl-ACP methyl ester carboxylesterase